MPDAVILSFPLGGRDGLSHVQEPPRCSNCQSVYLGVRGMWCGEFNEQIVYDDVAEECGSFDPYEPSVA